METSQLEVVQTCLVAIFITFNFRESSFRVDLLAIWDLERPISGISHSVWRTQAERQQKNTHWVCFTDPFLLVSGFGRDMIHRGILGGIQHVDVMVPVGGWDSEWSINLLLRLKASWMFPKVLGARDVYLITQDLVSSFFLRCTIESPPLKTCIAKNFPFFASLFWASTGKNFMHVVFFCISEFWIYIWSMFMCGTSMPPPQWYGPCTLPILVLVNYSIISIWCL